MEGQVVAEAQEQAVGQVVAEAQEQAVEAEWAEKDLDPPGSAYVLSAEKRHPISGEYHASSRSARSAIHP